MAKIKDQTLYFIAVIPTETIYSDAQKWKEHFASQYGSKASLNSPPHITLHMPFRLPEKKIDVLIKELKALAFAHNSFVIGINGYDAFAPRSIFMNVNANDGLSKLQKDIHSTMKTKLNIFNANYQDRPFHPHLTLAFRDLKKDKFEIAWVEFKNKSYSESFQVNEFCLLKHDGKRWEVSKIFQLRG